MPKAPVKRDSRMRRTSGSPPIKRAMMLVTMPKKTITATGFIPLWRDKSYTLLSIGKAVAMRSAANSDDEINVLER
jgi:hypothetical protein